MPKQDARKTLERLLELLRLLSATTGQQTAAKVEKALAGRGFATKRRTIERDLKLLESLNVIRCNRKGKPGGWTFNRGGAFVVPGIGVPEALSLSLLQDFLERMLPQTLWRDLKPRVEQASQALVTGGVSKAAARWTGAIRYVQPTLPLIPPKIDPDILGTVQEALLNELQLKVDYRGMGDEKAKPLTLNPLGIMQRGFVGYLVATVESYDDILLFALHRIHKAGVRPDKKARRPAGFSLDAYVESQGQFAVDDPARNIRLRARVVPDLARILEETALSSDQKLRAAKGTDDSIVTATLLDTRQLRWWILSQGTRMEVLAPKALREEIAVEVAALNKTYRKSSKRVSD